MGREEERQAKSEEKVDDRRDEYRFCFMEKPDKSVFEDNLFFYAYQRFANEHNRTMGFNVEHFFPKPVAKLLTLKSVTLSPLNTLLDYLHKKNDKSLSFVRIVRANYRSDSLFFITFEAKTKARGLINEYQSVIFPHFDHDQIVLHMFRKVGDVIGVVDFRESYYFCRIGLAFESDFDDKADFDNYQMYSEDYDNSEGFDIKNYYYPPPSLWALVLYLVDSKYTRKRCDNGVLQVLKYLESKKECTLKYKGIIKAQYNAANLFFVTFWGEDELGGLNQYQSVFRVQFTKKKIKKKYWLHMFRTKGEKQIARPIIDVRDEYVFFPAEELEDFDSTREQDNYKKYMKQHNESLGFDIETFISHPAPQKICQGNYYILRDCKVAIEHILDYLRSQYEENLQLIKIIKANYNSIDMYFVTFKARNRVSKQTNDYQSVILENYDGSIDLHMFRKKGDLVVRVYKS